MGAFYTNLTVRVPSRQDVLPLLAGRRAFVSPQLGGYVTIYDERCDEGGLYPNEFATELSQKLDTVVFLATVHDDDILYFDVFDKGDRLDEYDSCPDYFSEQDEDEGSEPLPPEGGNPGVLCEVFGCANRKAVEEVLYTQDEDSDLVIFAHERHGALAGLLGLPGFSVGYGYKYLATGDLPEGLVHGDLLELKT